MIYSRLLFTFIGSFPLPSFTVQKGNFSMAFHFLPTC